jgi:hypothetical protein
MKILLLIILLNFYFFSSFSQIYSGQLIDRESGQPILFANIGIVGKNIGTVSDVTGYFRIELNSKFDKDTLCISCIGYEKSTYLIGDFKDNIINADQVKIELLPKSYPLEEVIIQPVDTKTYTLGNFCEPNSPYGNAFYSDKLGTEMGVIINLPRKKNIAFLKNFRFYIGEFTFDRFPVRLNIYNLKNNQPYENILAEPIFLDISSAGEYIIDLEKYNIIVNGDFFISLEYYKIADQNEGELTFCAVHNRKMNKGNGYYRLTSQGDWKREMFDNVGFSVQVECEK